jgi:chromosome segregation ATPase
MEKGYFHFNLGDVAFDVDSELREAVRHVPLPNEIPAPARIDHLPQELLKSQAIENLIQQNEDLMSRLTVQVRKTARLESALQEADAGRKDFEAKIQSLKDQLLVFRRKEQLFENRTHGLQDRLDELEREVAFKTYALEQKDRLFDEVKEERNSLQARSERLRRYRDKLRRIGPQLRTRYRERARQLAMELDLRRSLQERIEDLTRRIQQMNQEHHASLDRLRVAHAEVSRENAQLQVHQAERRRLEDLVIEHENRILAQERAFLDRQQDYDQEIHGLQRELSLSRQDNKNKIVEIETLQRELHHRKHELQESRDQWKKSCDQVEALQALWNESLHKLERQDSQVASLQKLNQHLSLELHARQSSVTSAEDRSAIREIAESRSASQESATDEVFARIEGLIVDIQAGYTPSGNDSSAR